MSPQRCTPAGLGPKGCFIDKADLFLCLSGSQHSQAQPKEQLRFFGRRLCSLTLRKSVFPVLFLPADSDTLKERANVNKAGMDRIMAYFGNTFVAFALI